MEADFTLIPIGGLGNRINAICSVIVFCKKFNKSLKIIWFKDHGLNCSVKELMSINPDLDNIQMEDAKFSDFILRDNPRRKNLWIPKFFQFFLFDRRIYKNEVSQVLSTFVKSDFGKLDKYKHVFMINWGKFWCEPDMWKSITIKPQIKNRAEEIIKSFGNVKRLVGIHVRRTDHLWSIRNSPTELFVKKIQKEINLYRENVRFYLASDSLEVKNEIVSIFGDKIITSVKQTNRDTKEGIIDAFIEMNVLAMTDKIYAPGSSFSETAHFLSNNEFEIVSIDNL